MGTRRGCPSRCAAGPVLRQTAPQNQVIKDLLSGTIKLAPCEWRRRGKSGHRPPLHRRPQAGGTSVAEPDEKCCPEETYHRTERASRSLHAATSCARKRCAHLAQSRRLAVHAHITPVLLQHILTTVRESRPHGFCSLGRLSSTCVTLDPR